MREWYAIQTKPRRELMARGSLESIKEVEVYLPVLHVIPVDPRSRKLRPFFPGYLFARIDLAQMGLSAVKWSPGVARVLSCGNQPVVIPESVIDQVRYRVEEAQREKGLEVEPFHTGERVRITGGPFEGFEGMFDIHLGGQMRARILVEFLGRLTTTVVNIRHLEKMPPRDV